MRFTLLFLLPAVAALAHDEVTPKPKLLQNRVPIEKLAAHAGDTTVFQVIIPPQVESLVLKSEGGNGDCDLFLRRGAHPTRDKYDAASRRAGTREIIRESAPAAGVWYVLVDAYAGYRGVTLSATYQLQRDAIAVPRLNPAPGVFAGPTRVQLFSATKKTTLRYTTDGQEPSETSPAYTGALTLSTDTRLRVKAFTPTGAASPEVEAYYFIQAPGEIVTLTSGTPVHHRAGPAGAEHLFKITLPANQGSLSVSSESGPGNVDLLLKQGSPPTPDNFTHRSKQRGNRETIEVINPAAGDWFILLRGRTAFSGVSVLAHVRPVGVDLIAWQPALEPYVSVETFSPSDCEVDEGMITAGTHTLLRFSTETRNIGGSDLVMPDPAGNPAFEYADCHGHYHFLGFARYRLLDANGQEVATGRKVSFCLLDLSRWDPNASRTPRFDCGEQGIQAGWADIYDAGLPGQWIEIDHVPDGTYTLEVTMNADRLIEESDFTNNAATIQVVIDRP